MLYTRFIMPILTCAASCLMVRTICPPICACAAHDVFDSRTNFGFFFVRCFLFFSQRMVARAFLADLTGDVSGGQLVAVVGFVVLPGPARIHVFLTVHRGS